MIVRISRPSQWGCIQFGLLGVPFVARMTYGVVYIYFDEKDIKSIRDNGIRGRTEQTRYESLDQMYD